MANEVSIRVTIHDDTKAMRESIRAGFEAAGVDAGKAFNKGASEHMRGGDIGAKASDAFREMAVLGFGVSGADAAKEFDKAVSKGVEDAAGHAGKKASDAAREQLAPGFSAAGQDAVAEFDKSMSKGAQDSGGTKALTEGIRRTFSNAGMYAGADLRMRALEALGNEPVKVPVEAANPIDDVWRSKIQASIRSVAADAIKIPLSPDTAKFRDETQFLLGSLQHDLKTEIPLGIGDADKFKARAEALVKEVSAEVKAKIPVEADEQSAQDAGKKSGNGFLQGILGQRPLIAAAIVGGILAGGPLIAAAGVGVGGTMLLALGATLQKGNPVVDTAWRKLTADATNAATAASTGLVTPIATALGQIDQLVRHEQPVLSALFTDTAADIPILTKGLSDLVSNAFPGFESAMAASQPIVKGIADLMGSFGNVLGDVGTAIGKVSGEAGTGLHSLGTVVNTLGQALGELITFSAKFSSGALPALASGLSGVLSAAGGLLHVLEPIAPALGTIGVYGVEAFAGFKIADFATTSVNNLGKELTKAATGLESFGSKIMQSKLGTTEVGAAMGVATTGAANFTGKLASAASAAAGWLGPALGLASMALMVFGQATEEAAKKQKEQADLVNSVSQALEQSNGVVNASVAGTVASKLATDSNAKALRDYGVSAADIQQKVMGGSDVIGKQVSSLQAQRTALMGAAGSYVELGRGGRALTDSAQTQKSALDGQIAAWQGLANTMPDAVKQQQAWAAAVDASSQAMGIHIDHLNGFQQAQAAYDEALNNTVAKYLQQTASIKTYDDAIVGAAGANLSAQQSFKQLDDAVTSAEQSVVSAANGVSSAQHSLVDAGHAVVAARHSEQQSVQGVVDAQYSYQQSLQAEKQAQQNLMTARQAAADQLASLKRQVADQADSEAAAKLHLLEAQDAVKAAGLSGKTLAGLGDPTDANKTQYQLLLALSQAQHALNDTQATGAALDKQNAEAQKAGINGAAGVIAAQQALAQAQHATAAASRAVADAQFAERQASNAVQDALWGQHSAQLAVTQAQQAGAKAQRDLTAARENDSRTLDINTAAGNRNWKTVEEMYFKNLATGMSVDTARTATENETGALGFNRDAVSGVIDTLGGLNGKQFGFSVVGTPSLDLGPLRGILQNNDLGLFTNWKGESGGQASAGRLAAGGPISGPGGPTDDLVPLWASAGEFMQPADVVDHYGVGFMEALRQKKIPRFADGGSVSPVDMSGIMGLNLEVAALTGLYKGAGETANAMGARPPAPTGLSAAGNFSAGAFAGVGGGLGSLGPAPGVPQSQAANEAIVNAIFSSYGWGSGAEWDATVKLLMQESGFNNMAQNPTSTAFGIFQFLDDTWGGYGVPKTADATAQTVAGARYIQARYGDPLGAWAHEVGFNWYAAGGPVGGGLAGINDRGPELIKVPNGSVVATNADSRSMMANSGGSTEIRSTIEFSGNVDQALASVMMKLIRVGAIQIRQQYITK